MKFNTAVAAFMEFTNFWSQDKKTLSKKDASSLLILLAPFVPHITEELWEKIGHKESVFGQFWPKADEKLAKEETFSLVIQINGKVRDKVELAKDLSEDKVKEIVLQQEKIKKWLNGQAPKKFIYIPNRLVNIVV